MHKSVCNLLLYSTFLFVLTSCGEPPGSQPRGKTYQHSIFSFGTIIDISIYGTDEATAERAFDQLEADFNYMHATYHPMLRSALKRNNVLLATEEWFTDAPSIRPLLTQSVRLAKASDNLFNPAIGKLIRLWKINESENKTGVPPDDAEIKKLVKSNPVMSDIDIDGIRIKSRNSDVELNFGGFAKGYGIKKEIEMLKELGIKNAIINAGGDLHAIGSHGNRPWRIGIRHPRKENEVLAYIDAMDDESVFTSGDYERYFMYKGKRYHHILDPRTGYPASGAQSVTVIHKDPAIADAAATALFVAGPGDWQRIAKSMGISHVLLIDGHGVIHMTPDMSNRVHFKGKPGKIIISKPLQ